MTNFKFLVNILNSITYLDFFFITDVIINYRMLNLTRDYFILAS